MLKNNFKNFLNEDRDSDFNGLRVNGQVISVSIQKAKFNDLMEMKVEGSYPLTRLKSAEALKSEYEEKDWIQLEKIWAKMAESKSKDIEKLVKKFESDLNKIVVEMEKDISKF